MKYEVLFPFLVICLLLLVLTVIAAGDNYIRKRKNTGNTAILEKALSIIISCNTCPKMLTAFTRLEHNLEKYGIEVKDQFAGYFEDEHKESL